MILETLATDVSLTRTHALIRSPRSFRPASLSTSYSSETEQLPGIEFSKTTLCAFTHSTVAGPLAADSETFTSVMFPQGACTLHENSPTCCACPPVPATLVKEISSNITAVLPSGVLHGQGQ